MEPAEDGWQPHAGNDNAMDTPPDAVASPARHDTRRAVAIIARGEGTRHVTAFGRLVSGRTPSPPDTDLRRTVVGCSKDAPVT
jgi:hypothetical protein